MDGTNTLELEVILDRIESLSFAMNANVASSYRVFSEIVSGTDEYEALLELFAESPEDANVIAKRIRELAAADVPFGQVNGFDVSIATYLLSILRFDSTMARVAGRNASRAQNAWWVREAIERLDMFGMPDSCSAWLGSPKLPIDAHVASSNDISFRSAIDIDVSSGHVQIESTNVAMTGALNPSASLPIVAERGKSGSARHEVKST